MCRWSSGEPVKRRDSGSGKEKREEAHLRFREAQQVALKAEDGRKQSAAVPNMGEGTKAGAPSL